MWFVTSVMPKPLRDYSKDPPHIRTRNNGDSLTVVTTCHNLIFNLFALARAPHCVRRAQSLCFAKRPRGRKEALYAIGARDRCRLMKLREACVRLCSVEYKSKGGKSGNTETTPRRIYTIASALRTNDVMTCASGCCGTCNSLSERGPNERLQRTKRFTAIPNWLVKQPI
jgi:hypothetical protein